jgi:hypothetical protein
MTFAEALGGLVRGAALFFRRFAFFFGAAALRCIGAKP